MVEDIELATPSLRLAARAWGRPGRRPVLALHGWLDNAASFDRLAPLLPDWHIVALDFPGHGRSQHRPPGVAYHFVDYVGDVVAAADALGWKRFSLLGHSLGAGVASFVAATIPERVARLALIEGLGPPSGAPQEGPQRLAKAIRFAYGLATKSLPRYADVQAAAQARADATWLSVQAALPIAIRGTQRLGNERLGNERLGDQGADPGEGRIGWRSDPRLTQRSPWYLCEEQIRAFVAAIRAPTLLIRAHDGLLHRRAWMQGRYPLVKQLQLVDLPGNHHLHLEDPEPSARVLRGFLRG